ncbi:hypothetical protein J6590_100769, partial [Homalodisca vitripennis]
HESALNHRRARECNAYWTRKLAINLSSQMDDFNKSVHPRSCSHASTSELWHELFMKPSVRRAMCESELSNKVFVKRAVERATF